MFAGDQIHFVQVRIHSSRAANLDEKMKQGLPFFCGQVALIGVILAACRFGLFSMPWHWRFFPCWFAGRLWFVRRHRPLDVHKLGFSELTHAVDFRRVAVRVVPAVIFLRGSDAPAPVQ